MKKPTNRSGRIEQKTAPRGMAPDKAHGSHEMTADRRNSEAEETFNNSPQNAESKQTRQLK
jgi:hypothetical protein